MELARFCGLGRPLSVGGGAKRDPLFASLTCKRLALSPYALLLLMGVPLIGRRAALVLIVMACLVIRLEALGAGM